VLSAPGKGPNSWIFPGDLEGCPGRGNHAVGGVMRFRSLVVFVLLAVSLSACSAALVPLSFDPKTKLGQAYQLMYEFERPLPAERLIQEAYDIYQDRQDEKGMAQASLLYGYFFLAPAVSKWSHVYSKAGFNDGTQYPDRFRRSAEYYQRSADLFSKIGEFDSATNAQLLMGFSYIRARDLAKACSSYEQSLESYRKNMAANPGTKVTLPDGFSSYEDVIRDAKTRAECA
jgi:tetratricopeptide (TPR) repeat protein